MEHIANVKELNQSSARDKAARAVFTASAFFSVVAVAGIVFFIMLESLPAFSEIGVLNFIFGTTWAPTKDFLPVSERFGILPMIVGSLVVTAGATLVGGTMGVFTAIFLAYFCPKRLKAVFNQVINLLAGIPSIVYGYFGLVVLVPLLAEVSPTNSGQGALAGSLILGIMILPTVASIVRNSIESVPGLMGMDYSLLAGGFTLALIILPTIIRATEESILAVPDSLREAGLALGAGKARTIFKVVLPAAMSGIVTSIILSIGRIVGESAALIYTAGAVPYTPSGYLDQGSSFAVMMWMFAGEGMYVDSAYATACILMIFVALLNLLVTLCERKFRKKQGIAK